jgi:hypothetical protein
MYIELNWSIPVEEDAMGSDHEVIAYENLQVVRLAANTETLHTKS